MKPLAIKTIPTALAAAFALGNLFAAGHPDFAGKPYVVEGELESLDVPVEGWRVS